MVIGTSYQTTINKCYNKAKIESKNGSAAGIFGSGGGTITECGNEGDIICNGSGSQAAGISILYVSMNKCYNTGNITSQNGWIVGGICGRYIGSNPPIIKNSYNTGNLKGNTSGGITAWGRS